MDVHVSAISGQDGFCVFDLFQFDIDDIAKLHCGHSSEFDSCRSRPYSECTIRSGDYVCDAQSLFFISDIFAIFTFD